MVRAALPMLQPGGALTSAMPTPATPALPQDLTMLPQWVCWKLQSRDGGKPTKIPYQPDGTLADSTDSSTWTTYERALAAHSRGGFSGVGFVFARNGGLVGIDLDHCVSDAGTYQPWALPILARFGRTYMEFSPSGTGLHLFARGKLPGGGTAFPMGDDGRVEVYGSGRYFTMTNDPVDGAIPQIAENQAAIDWLLALSPNGERKTPFVVQGKIPKGVQHDSLVSLAGTMRKRGCEYPEILAALLETNRIRLTEPAPQSHIERIAASVCRYATETAQGAPVAAPHVFDVAEIMALDIRPPSMLVDCVLPQSGASLIVGAPKSGKTILSIQMALSIASGQPFLGRYSVLCPGPVLVIEHDDPAATASVKEILTRSEIRVRGLPFHLVPRLPFAFGLQFIEWLETEIKRLELRAVILDSYTSLRGARVGNDVVKNEQHDMTLLDELAKRTNCAIALVHHDSKGSKALDWCDQAAGSYAMTAATEAQLHVSRYRDLDSNAPERLIRIRGRHQAGLELVARFSVDTLSHDFVLAGSAAPVFPLIAQIREAFGGGVFGPKELSQALAISRPTAHRHIERLRSAGVINRRGYGEYLLVASEVCR
jgi:hypothetical protein